MTKSAYTRTARAALLAVIAVACSPDRILQVEDIDVALPPAVQGVEALPSLLAGVIGDFGTAYNGGVQSTGLALDLNQVTLGRAAQHRDVPDAHRGRPASAAVPEQRLAARRVLRHSAGAGGRGSHERRLSRVRAGGNRAG